MHGGGEGVTIICDILLSDRQPVRPVILALSLQASLHTALLASHHHGGQISQVCSVPVGQLFVGYLSTLCFVTITEMKSMRQNRH
jgi:hypothetical protein